VLTGDTITSYKIMLISFILITCPRRAPSNDENALSGKGGKVRVMKPVW